MRLVLLIPLLLHHSYALVCNDGTEYRCVCRQEDVSSPAELTTLDKTEVVLCEQFIASHELPVVDMRLRHVDLTASLHTNEKYEQYFKRRIANIVSAYCEHQANECPGATLRLSKQVHDDVLYADDDESEPLLSQDNVVLFDVQREPRNVTRIQFAVTKNDRNGALSEGTVIDPVKVKYILGSQAGPLSRILGGIRIDSVRVSRLKRALTGKDDDNSKLLLFVYIVAAFFATCYIIGAIRLCRDCRRRKKQKEAAARAATEEAVISAKVTPNYGTCDDKVKEGFVPRNGHVNGGLGGGIHVYAEINEVAPEPTPPQPRITDRQARLMFGCDNSQLPREVSFDGEQLSFTPSTVSRQSKTQSPTVNLIAHDMEQKPSPPSMKPPPVLVTASSLHESSIELSRPPTTTQDSIEGIEPPVDHRPKSRRSSRIDEEDMNHVDTALNNMPNSANNWGADLLDRKSVPKREDDQWSSSEGEVDVYYKMSDDEEIKADNWGNLNAAPGTTQTPVAPVEPKVIVNGRHSSHDESSSSEDEECSEAPVIRKPMRRIIRKEDKEPEPEQAYELLREEMSPIPPPLNHHLHDDGGDEDDMK